MTVLFKSKRDFLFAFIVYTCVVFFTLMIVYDFYKNGVYVLFPHVITLAVSVLLLWIFYFTDYKLTDALLIYKCGPLRGKIKINSIKEIVVGKTLWVGLKPATARNGLIVKFNKYDEIYISPETNEMFISEILKRNPEIKIVY